MAVRIRLRRMGSNKRPFFRIVAADARFSNTGRVLDNLGWYDPLKKGLNLHVDLDRVAYWTARGAQVTETVRSLIRRQRAAARQSHSA